jgi:glucuronate isomerase-like protein
VHPSYFRYPAVYVGVPWWFLDAPEAMRRFRAAVMETAGFSCTSGFVDDTRAFCSIPARHDMSRRIDAGVLAQLVAAHQLEEEEALETAGSSSRNNPQRSSSFDPVTGFTRCNVILSGAKDPRLLGSPRDADSSASPQNDTHPIEGNSRQKC